jgi:dolichyl-phosphate beta-glucosyltransferase
LIKRKTAQIVYKTLHIQIAEMLELPIGEVSVRWSEIEGSKLNPIVDAVKMFMDIALLWLRYAIGAWKLPSKQE